MYMVQGAYVEQQNIRFENAMEQIRQKSIISVETDLALSEMEHAFYNVLNELSNLSKA